MSELNALRHLALGYFHEDYDLDYPTPMDVIVGFKNNEPNEVGALISEIRNVLDRQMSEKEMHDTWIIKLHASYDPVKDGRLYRQWFEDIIRLLSE